MIHFERRAERLIQRQARVVEINQRGDLGRLRSHQVALLLHHIE